MFSFQIQYLDKTEGCCYVFPSINDCHLEAELKDSLRLANDLNKWVWLPRCLHVYLTQEEELKLEISVNLFVNQH